MPERWCPPMSWDIGLGIRGTMTSPYLTIISSLVANRTLGCLPNHMLSSSARRTLAVATAATSKARTGRSPRDCGTYHRHDDHLGKWVDQGVHLRWWLPQKSQARNLHTEREPTDASRLLRRRGCWEDNQRARIPRDAWPAVRRPPQTKKTMTQ